MTRPRPAAKRKPRRSRAEIMLERFEAIEPDTLDDDQRRYRSFAIRALRIELELRDQGLVGKRRSNKGAF